MDYRNMDEFITLSNIENQEKVEINNTIKRGNRKTRYYVEIFQYIKIGSTMCFLFLYYLGLLSYT